MLKVRKTRADIIREVRKCIVKVGTSSLTDDGAPDPRAFKAIADQVAALRMSGVLVLLVSSGAIASGMTRMNMRRKPSNLQEKQATAAVGQSVLMEMYSQAFKQNGLAVGQVLITHDDLDNRERFLNARNTIQTLLRMGVVPVMNENDTVAVEEIKVGDNDNLAAHAVSLVDADLLVILSDINGVYSDDPSRNRDAILIDTIDDIGMVTGRVAASSRGKHGTGGMATKIEAAARAAAFGVPTIIANGRKPDTLSRIFAGERIGTLIIPGGRGISKRKHWIGYTSKIKGAITVDDGAARAISHGGKSLLPSGIRSVCGPFKQGETVRVINEQGGEIARGMAQYCSVDLERIKGLKSAEIKKILGTSCKEEAIHRDDMVII
jgi:glutamate 5-kinase